MTVLVCDKCKRREVAMIVPVTVQNFGRGTKHLLDRVVALCEICWAMSDL